MKIIEEQSESVDYYVFSEDIDWCRENLSTDQNITFIDRSYNDYKDTGHLYLMTKWCKDQKTYHSKFIFFLVGCMVSKF